MEDLNDPSLKLCLCIFHSWLIHKYKRLKRFTFTMTIDYPGILERGFVIRKTRSISLERRNLKNCVRLCSFWFDKESKLSSKLFENSFKIIESKLQFLQRLGRGISAGVHFDWQSCFFQRLFDYRQSFSSSSRRNFLSSRFDRIEFPLVEEYIV